MFLQGPRSNFKIGGAGGGGGGRGTISDSILGGGGESTKHFFLLILYNFKNIGARGGAPLLPLLPPSLLRGPCSFLPVRVAATRFSFYKNQ